MTDILTHEEYQALAAGLDFPTAAFVDGAYRPAVSGKTTTSYPTLRYSITPFSKVITT